MTDKCDVSIIASANNWVEGEAVRQLEQTATYAGMRYAVGMPDLHPGKGNPIGAAFATEDLIYPWLVGGDIGCGMALWTTDVNKGRVKQDKWVKALHNNMEKPLADQMDLERKLGAPIETWLRDAGVQPSGYEWALGTVGGGNHFAEVQSVAEVHDQARFDALGLHKNKVMLLVHSGSRGYGKRVLDNWQADHGARGVRADSIEGQQYLAEHDNAANWAEKNRDLIAYRMADLLGVKIERALDIRHNTVTQEPLQGEDLWIHRKGAAPSNVGPVVIPGSRGTYSYLVQPTASEIGGLSLAHGAGRKWKRGDVKARLYERYSPEQLTRTDLGSRVICKDRELLYDEAPQAYKDINVVIQDLVDAGLVTIIAKLQPVITFKRGKDCGC